MRNGVDLGQTDPLLSFFQQRMQQNAIFIWVIRQ
jgi:hypothetical protein